MSPARAIILDFDGTLVESVGVKDEAFRALFADRVEHIDEIMRYHLAHNATLRFEKFRHITETILREPYDDATRERLSRRFSEMVFSAIVACPPVRGLDRFLARFGGRVPLVLVSMSPDEELARILAARGMADVFERVYAGSWKKIDAIADALARLGLSPHDAVFVGDAPEDRASAEAAGVRFIGRDSGKDLGPGVPIFQDLDGVGDEILALGALSGARHD